MSSIQIEDHVGATLEGIAAARGLSLSDYLAVIAASDAQAHVPPSAPEHSLAELMAPILAEAKANRPEPRPTSADPMKAEFDAAMAGPSAH